MCGGKRALRIARRGCQRRPSRGAARGETCRRIRRCAAPDARRAKGCAGGACAVTTNGRPANASFGRAATAPRGACVHDDRAAVAASDRNDAISRQPRSEDMRTRSRPLRATRVTRAGGSAGGANHTLSLVAIAAASAMTARGRAGSCEGARAVGNQLRCFLRANDDRQGGSGGGGLDDLRLQHYSPRSADYGVMRGDLAPGVRGERCCCVQPRRPRHADALSG
jgi:hypothetical protein